MKVPYRKPPLSTEQQADLLISRGLIIHDRNELIDFLSRVSYYRLTAYLFPFKKTGSEHYEVGTTFETIYRRYTFDRRFRLLILDALERFETAMKARIVNVFVMRHGALGYLDIHNYNDFSPDKFDRFLNEIREAVKKSSEKFVKHFLDKYSDQDLPLWMASELITFGTMFTMFRNMNYQEQKEIAETFQLPVKILKSWLHTLNYIRNICAHHARLWNKRLGVAPQMPKRKGFEAWTAFDTEKPFFILLMLSHLLKCCAPHTHWRTRMEELIDEYGELPFEKIGFSPGWKENSIWKNDFVKLPDDD